MTVVLAPTGYAGNLLRPDWFLFLFSLYVEEALGRALLFSQCKIAATRNSLAAIFSVMNL
jgi:hypothetical protein